MSENQPSLVLRDRGRQEQRVIRKCHDCGKNMCGTRQTYRYVECGLSFVVLQNVLVFECRNCGLKVPEIPAITELHNMIAFTILCKRTLLAGEEVRFLRKIAGLSQAELAEIMGVHNTRPSKWEKDGIGKESDRLLRVFCLFGLAQQLSTGRDESVLMSLATNEEISKIDVRELLANIIAETAEPMKIKVKSNPTGETGKLWLLSQQARGSQTKALR